MYFNIVQISCFLNPLRDRLFPFVKWQENEDTIMCLSIGTLKKINFPFVPNGKFIIFRCPKIWAIYSLIIMCSIIGTSNNYHFPFRTNGKVVVLGVPILKHFRVTPFTIK